MPFPKPSKETAKSGASKPAPDAVNQTAQAKEKKTKAGNKKMRR